MEGESGEQVGDELESVTSSAECFVQDWHFVCHVFYKIEFKKEKKRLSVYDILLHLRGTMLTSAQLQKT